MIFKRASSAKISAGKVFYMDQLCPVFENFTFMYLFYAPNKIAHPNKLRIQPDSDWIHQCIVCANVVCVAKVGRYEVAGNLMEQIRELKATLAYIQTLFHPPQPQPLSLCQPTASPTVLSHQISLCFVS
jgi:hypothetical protein